MLKLRFSLLAFAITALSVLAMSFSSQSVDKSVTKGYFSSVTYEWIGSDFAIGTTDSGPLNSSSNWRINSPNICSGFTNICEVIVSFAGTTPTLQQVIDNVRSTYDSNGKLFVDGQQWTANINGETVQFLVHLKN